MESEDRGTRERLRHRNPPCRYSWLGTRLLAVPLRADRGALADLLRSSCTYSSTPPSCAQMQDAADCGARYMRSGEGRTAHVRRADQAGNEDVLKC